MDVEENPSTPATPPLSDHAQTIIKLTASLRYLARMLEDYDEVDRDQSWLRNGTPLPRKPKRGPRFAIENLREAMDAVNTASELTDKLPRDELARKLGVALCLPSDEIGHADLAAKLALADGNAAASIEYAREGLRRAHDQCGEILPILTAKVEETIYQRLIVIGSLYEPLDEWNDQERLGWIAEIARFTRHQIPKRMALPLTKEIEEELGLYEWRLNRLWHSVVKDMHDFCLKLPALQDNTVSRKFNQELFAELRALETEATYRANRITATSTPAEANGEKPATPAQTRFVAGDKDIEILQRMAKKPITRQKLDVIYVAGISKERVRLRLVEMEKHGLIDREKGKSNSVGKGKSGWAITPDGEKFLAAHLAESAPKARSLRV